MLRLYTENIQNQSHFVETWFSNFGRRSLQQYATILLVLLSSTIISCNKDEFLSKKPSSELVVPTTIDELQGLLNNEDAFWETPLLGIQSSDEYYWNYSDWQSRQSVKDRNAYVWSQDIYEGDLGATIGDWNTPFNQIFISNIALEGSNNINPESANLSELNRLKGVAHFFRAKAMFGLAEVFTLPYDKSTAGVDLGLPLKVSSNVNFIPKRSTVKETYDQILSDLLIAKDLLVEKTITPNRQQPTKLTCYALLARIYLAMRDYKSAGQFADSVLTNYNKLMNFNGLSTIILTNIESLYHNTVISGNRDFTTTSGIVNVDTNLLKLYSANDLRLTVFFKKTGNRTVFNRFYSGSTLPYTGMAIDEMYLIRAEYYARENLLAKASEDINTLLVNRYKTNTYSNVSYNSQPDAIKAVLTERRKELVFRGARWSDVRRLNKEGANITMLRKLDDQEILLPANDKRFAISIPRLEIELSGMEQNLR